MNIYRLLALSALLAFLICPQSEAQKLSPGKPGNGGAASSGGGGGVYVPPGLSPGDEYHIAFITNGGTQADSTDINDYNAFVQSEAALNANVTGTSIGVQYFAIGSTQSVPANQNAVASAPIYMLDGTKIADGHSDLYDGSIDSHFNIDQFQNELNDNRIWTGALPFGQNGGGIELGQNIPGTGNNFVTTTSWITDWNQGRLAFNPMYALSEKLIVPVDVVTPDSVNVITGYYESGQLSDVYESDDSYLCYERGDAFSPFLPDIWMEFFGTLPNDSPAALKVTLECQVNDIGIDQGIEMYNFDTSSFESVDLRDATLNSDQVVEIDLTGDVTRFVEPGTGVVRTKVTFKSDGTGFFASWTACIDQLIWSPQ